MQVLEGKKTRKGVLKSKENVFRVLWSRRGINWGKKENEQEEEERAMKALGSMN